TRRLEQLERHLSVRLFARTPSGLMITPEAAAAVQMLDDVAARLESVERHMQGGDATMAGPVRINAPEVFHGEFFMSAMAELARQYPDIVVEIGSAWRPPDLDKREVDLSIMLTNDPPGHLIGRPLGHMDLAAYDRIDRAGTMDGRWLDSALERAVAAQYASRVFPERPLAGYLESIDLQLAAVVAGMGSTLLPCYLGDEDSRLARVRGTSEAPELRRAMWLMSHPDSRGVARLQAVAGVVIEALRGHDLQAQHETGLD
ncbi:MAG: LysR family transcriptional regulator, partial [Gammaproteobacteria bacterium]|nr:LysR family transcriptional regulator [Gammaproteobacteria bacterium]